MNKRLHKSLEKYNNSKEDTIIPISGTLGIPLGGQKLVEVPNRPGFVYVKLKDNTSEVIQAYNSAVSTTYDLPVLVIRQNNIYRVLSRNLDLYRDWGNIPYLPKHGGQHSFNPALSMGADITWVYSQQIMPLLGYPSGTEGSARVSIAPYLVRDLSGNWKYVGNTGTQSTTIYNPTTGSRAVMALVYLDTVSGNPYLLVNSGTYISDSLTGTNQVAPYIPQLTNPNHIPITAIRLLSGTAVLTWNNLYDARPFLQVVPTGSSGLIIQDEGIFKGTVTTLNVVGPNADISVSGSVARLFITGSTGGGSNPPVTGSMVFQNAGQTLGSATIINAFDGINISISGSTALLYPTNTGWISSPYPWNFLLSDSPSFVVSINANVTGTMAVGIKVQLTHQNSTKNFFLTAISVTGSTSYLNLYGGTDYTLNVTGAITNPLYSYIQNPFGFPVDPDKWTVLYTNSTNASQASPPLDTFVNPGSLSFSAPIGLWKVYSHISNEVRVNLSGGAGNFGCRCSISNITGSASYPQLTRESLEAGAALNPALHRFSATCSGELINLAAKTNLFLVTSTSQTATQLNFRGDLGGLTTTVRLLCAYL